MDPISSTKSTEMANRKADTPHQLISKTAHKDLQKIMSFYLALISARSALSPHSPKAPWRWRKTRGSSSTTTSREKTKRVMEKQEEEKDL